MATPDRWAPWIEPRISATSDTTINSGNATDITGCTITFTPHINTRVFIYAAVFVRADALTPGASDFLLLRLDVNGSSSSNEDILWQPQATGVRITLPGLWIKDLTKATTYTIKLRGLVSTLATGSYVVRSPNTGLAVVAMPNLHS